MQSGVEVVKTEGKTSEELAAEVKAKKQKYKLDELRAKMLSETEDMQSWQLTGELGVHMSDRSRRVNVRGTFKVANRYSGL